MTKKRLRLSSRIAVIHHAFTLIELLIVIAIIAILALIAIPNFLEAQTRAKVSRALADMRTLATAVNAYYVDYNSQPPTFGNAATPGEYTYNSLLFQIMLAGGGANYCTRLTTPVAYISSIDLEDPFDRFGNAFPTVVKRAGYAAFMVTGALQDGTYVNWWKSSFPDTYALAAPGMFMADNNRRAVRFMLASPGPSLRWSVKFTGLPSTTAVPGGMDAYVNGKVSLYDPSNGTISVGEIIRFE